MSDADQAIEFGAAVRREFMLSSDTVFLNHASYGSMPRCVHERQVRYLAELETYPDKWFRFSMYEYLAEAVQTVAEFVGTAPEDTFLMQNVTKAINTVLKTCPLTSNDAILITNLTYGAVEVTSRITAEATNCKVHTVELPFPIQSEADVLDAYSKYLSKHEDIKVAVIDHITSPSTVILPIKKLVELCHKHDVIVVVDGAQAPGQLPLDLQDYDADFYTGNLHKWVYCPRACAFLWRNPKRTHDWFRPLVTSAFEKCGLSRAFQYEGTKDDSPYICSADGIRFYQRLGGMDAITRYTSTLKTQGVEYLEKKWNTRRLPIPTAMIPPNFVLIALPFIDGFSDKPERCLELQYLIAERFNIQTNTVNIQNVLYMRVSFQVYTTMDDVIKLGEAILSLSSK